MEKVTKVYEVYQYDELDDKAKGKAIECLYDINVDHEWWEQVYEDADNVGLKITGFDIGRGACCNGDFIDTASDTIRRILEEHGNHCETYKTAKEHQSLVSDEDGEYESYVAEFLKAILEDYRVMLQKEYEYLTSREAIESTIEANEYGFKVDGTFPAY